MNWEKQMIAAINRNADCKYLESKLSAISAGRRKRGLKSIFAKKRGAKKC